MVKVKNIAPGPRGLYDREGLVMLRPGEERDLDVVAAEVASAKSAGWFTFAGGSSKDEAAAYDAMSDDELRAILKDKGVAADGRWGHDKLVSEARKVG